MPRVIQKGSTDVTLYFFIQDSTSGAPETGVTITDLDLQYVRFGATPAAKVDATALAATNSAHGDNQAIEVDATDQPGLYRVDWPDAAFATGVDGVILTVKGTGFHPAHMEIQLVDYDPTDSVRLGLTALPNAAADGVGGLPISDAGGLDIDTKLANTNEITVARMGALTDWINGGRLDLLLDQVITDIAALNNISTADVNAQVVDVINTDTSGEPAQGAPAATASLRTKIDFLYKFMRNKIETTATEIDVYDDAGTTVDHKSTISDDTTTFTRGEFVSGP